MRLTIIASVVAGVVLSSVSHAEVTLKTVASEIKGAESSVSYEQSQVNALYADMYSRNQSAPDSVKHVLKAQLSASGVVFNDDGSIQYGSNTLSVPESYAVPVKPLQVVPQPLAQSVPVSHQQTPVPAHVAVPLKQPVAAPSMVPQKVPQPQVKEMALAPTKQAQGLAPQKVTVIEPAPVTTIQIEDLSASAPRTATKATQQAVSLAEPVKAPVEAPVASAVPDAETIQAVNDLIDAHNENVTAIDNNTAHIQSLEQSTNQRFADMGKRVDDNRKRAAVGVAGVAAMANIPQVTDNQSFSVGAGIGDYDNQQAVAVGFSARVSQHIVTKAAVSAGSFGGASVGAGMSWGW